MQVTVKATTARATLIPAIRPGVSALTASGHAGVAAAVLTAAVHDANRVLTKYTPVWSIEPILKSIDFLWSDNPDLRFWCAVAGIDAQAVNRVAREHYRRKYAIGQRLIAERDAREQADQQAREQAKADGVPCPHRGRPLTRRRWPAWRAAMGLA